MRRLLSLIACLGVLAPIAAGCGEDESFSVSAAEAAKATRNEENAKVAMKVDVSGAGLPMPVTVKAKGVTAISDAKMNLDFDFGPLLGLTGAKVSDPATKMIVDGGNVWVDPPAIEGLELPGGAKWVTADVGELLKAMGIEADGFGELMRLSPDQQLAALQGAGGVKEVGQEKINGEETVHLKGTIKLADYLAQLPEDRRKAAEKAIEELGKLPGGGEQDFDVPQQIDMWIGEDKLVRRMVSKIDTPAQQGVPAMKMTMTMDLSDYGTDLDVAAPPKDETYDATEDLSKLMQQAAQQQGLPTPG